MIAMVRKWCFEVRQGAFHPVGGAVIAVVRKWCVEVRQGAFPALRTAPSPVGGGAKVRAMLAGAGEVRRKAPSPVMDSPVRVMSVGANRCETTPAVTGRSTRRRADRTWRSGPVVAAVQRGPRARFPRAPGHAARPTPVAGAVFETGHRRAAALAPQQVTRADPRVGTSSGKVERVKGSSDGT